ncbi:MAG TPA: GAF domain-containing protein [Acidobacteriaceae bacterium]|nr:GAF domain-containing protein [Acidobacteriaceae bacterium]
MVPESAQLDSGMYLRDLHTDADFHRRNPKPHDSTQETMALRRLAKALDQSPDFVLQELVDTTLAVCEADSAGISLEEPETQTFRWVAVAGSFAKYLNGRTQRNYSPCGTCLDSGRPQLYRLTKPYYDHLGVTAKPIRDGVLIPWASGSLKGTLWSVSHSADEAFDHEDFLFLTHLAEFASVILKYKHQQLRLRADEKASTVEQMANDMAHIINNPLQRLTNTIFLARRDQKNADRYLDQAEQDLIGLSNIVAAMLKRSFDRTS